MQASITNIPIVLILNVTLLCFRAFGEMLCSSAACSGTRFIPWPVCKGKQPSFLYWFLLLKRIDSFVQSLRMGFERFRHGAQARLCTYSVPWASDSLLATSVVAPLSAVGWRQSRGPVHGLCCLCPLLMPCPAFPGCPRPWPGASGH